MDDAEGAWDITPLDVRRALADALADDRAASMAVVVDVEGSAYRRPGARMVITEEESLGAVTAGCLEGPVAEQARGAIDAGMGDLRTYDLTDDDDESWGMGLGCNGIIEVFVDPIDGSLAPALAAVERGESAVVLTVVESAGDVPVGARTTIGADGGRLSGSDGASDRDVVGDDVLGAVEAAVGPIADVTETRIVTVTVDGEEHQVVLDRFDPIPVLLLFGSQGDVRPMARLGREAGFRPVVASPRGVAADAERFPTADEVGAVRAPDLASAVEVPELTYPVLMSHNFVDDRMALESILETAVPYVGLMGPRERFDELREEMAAAGRRLGDDDFDRIATPVGLDVGADSPTQIALSVVSEVLAVHNDKRGGRLVRTGEPVHPR